MSGFVRSRRVVSAGETVSTGAGPGPGGKGRPVREGANPYTTHPQ